MMTNANDYLAWQQQMMLNAQQATAQINSLAHQNAAADLYQSGLTAYGLNPERNIFAVIEEQRIAKAKADYPAWFESAREWDKIP